MSPQISGGRITQRFSSRLSNSIGHHNVWPSCLVSRRPRLRGKALERCCDWLVSSICSANPKLKANQINPRTRLIETLLELQKCASCYINQSRLQLALRGLEQKCGEETIRMAILGIGGRKSSRDKVRQILRLLLADPSKSEEAWEQILLSESTLPVLLKFGPKTTGEIIKENNLVQEMRVSSSLLNGQNVEILLLNSEPPTDKMAEEDFVEAVLVPSVKIPSSNTERDHVVRVPVHRTLLVSEGLFGAVKILNFPVNINHHDIIRTIIDINIPDNQESSIPSQLINVNLATKALEDVRGKNVDYHSYKNNWSASGLPKLQEWLQTGILSTDKGMKEALRRLIESLLKNTSKSIRDEHSRLISLALSKKIPQTDITRLKEKLRNWAYRSHTELRDNLEIAFKGKKWRKLSWWKLLWRVDDIPMIASDILNHRFLKVAEQEAIFFAGCIEERCIWQTASSISSGSYDGEPKYHETSQGKLGDIPKSAQLKDILSTPEDKPNLEFKCQPWPSQIPATRLYLSHTAIPSLQLLGQKLVVQTLCFSSLSVALSGLIYISSTPLGLYEIGIVAMLGIVTSLRRMQVKWEKARETWEGEVKEEGRKALRSVEATFHQILATEITAPDVNEIIQAKSAIQTVEKALLTCK